MSNGLEDLKEFIIEGNADNSVEKVQALLDEGVSVGSILNDSLIAAMSVVGDKFENKEYFVPELLVAARAMKRSMEVIRPHLVKAGIESHGKVVVGTVRGDQHDIGKNLIAMMFEGAGFEIIDLGVNVEPGKFVEAVKSEKALVLGMSALLTTTMPAMSETIDALKKEELNDRTLVIVGGAPLTQNYSEKIGADLYAPNAAAAVRVVKEKLKRL